MKSFLFRLRGAREFNEVENFQIDFNVRRSIKVLHRVNEKKERKEGVRKGGKREKEGVHRSELRVLVNRTGSPNTVLRLQKCKLITESVCDKIRKANEGYVCKYV